MGDAFFDRSDLARTTMTSLRNNLKSDDKSPAVASIANRSGYYRHRNRELKWVPMGTDPGSDAPAAIAESRVRLAARRAGVNSGARAVARWRRAAYACAPNSFGSAAGPRHLTRF